MITSERQLKAAEKKLAMLKQSLTAPTKAGVAKIIVEAAQRQTQSLIEEMESEIEDYKKTLATKPEEIAVNSMDELMIAPIRYRLSARLSVDRFAQLVEVSARQISRYEQNEYMNCSIDNFNKILRKLNIRLKGQFETSVVPMQELEQEEN